MTCPWSQRQLVTELNQNPGLLAPSSVTDGLSLIGLETCLLFIVRFLSETVF